ncbi:MAG TPA: M14 family zinc carboxypeptidase [Solirubrobacteraceae bacterium]|nr:M14 family zinc carboxypeptidase [Solirubrobacteraceae bacterium]
MLLALVAMVAIPASSASAAAPPWCGTPEPDAAANLPDGSLPTHPVGSFPHIPYYAIKCTLQDIQSRSRGRMRLEVIGKSATRREMFGVTINRLRTGQEKRDYASWLAVRSLMLESPIAAASLARHFGNNIKVPVFIQGGIHGNEYEGVDAAIDTIEKFATTPYGTDPKIDAILNHTILVFNPIQNPDGRVAGTRVNGNGFDLNRDYLTQSQSEVLASVGFMKRWLAPEMLDMHGYVSPTLIEATTKPHNPSIEYDNWLKWNQARIDYNEAAMDAAGQDVTRPINDWCPEGDAPSRPDRLCDAGETPGPDVAEGWDDWGPFYGPMYHQHIGLDSSTVEMCSDTALNPPFWRPCGGRAGARLSQNVVQQSTLEFVVANRKDMLHDELVNYIRGDIDAPRPECCDDPFKPEFHNWMQDYPQAYVIPFGAGQRSDAEANRLVEWLLFNDIEVDRVEKDYKYNGTTLEEGSYVVWMAQPHRGLADTALSIGVDISPRIQRLYAPPAAWSHGYLWGADTVTIPDGAKFRPKTDEVRHPNRLKGGVESGSGTTKAYTLEIDSPTAVRALNAVVGQGVAAQLALEPFSAGPAGTALFATDMATKNVLENVGDDTGLTFRRLKSGALPATKAVDHVPRFRVITGANGTAATDQSTWVLRDLGFTADPITVQQINDMATDPLTGYDVVYNATSAYPAATGGAARPIARERFAAFFAAGGGYIGGQTAGSTFLTGGAQVTGLTPASRGGNGRSGIVYWDNTGGTGSVITGAMPARDTAIVDPPTWLTAVPSGFSVDGRLPAANFFAAGLWPIAGDAGSATAPGAAIIAHGPNAANTANLVVFANNPLYRADPEREWPMVGTAAYWADR